MKAFPLATAALGCLLLAQCRHADPAPPAPIDQASLLPLATTSGARTFGCLVNGQAWTPAGDPFAGPLFTAQYSNTNHLRVVANRNLKSNGTTVPDVIQIEIDKCNAPGRYILTKRDTSFINCEQINSQCTYYTDATHPAQVTITRLDLVNRIVSGEFTGTLETPGCGKLALSYGRFDTRF